MNGNNIKNGGALTRFMITIMLMGYEGGSRKLYGGTSV